MTATNAQVEIRLDATQYELAVLRAERPLTLAALEAAKKRVLELEVQAVANGILVDQLRVEVAELVEEIGARDGEDPARSHGLGQNDPRGA